MKRNFSRRSGAKEELVGCRLRVVDDGAVRDAWVLAFDSKLGHLVHYSEQETWWEALKDLEYEVCDQEAGEEEEQQDEEAPHVKAIRMDLENPVSRDAYGNSFYKRLPLQCGALVEPGDCVKVQVANSMTGDAWGYCQVLAIWKDKTNTSWAEARWFLRLDELDSKHKRKHATPPELVRFELFESDLVDIFELDCIAEFLEICTRQEIEARLFNCHHDDLENTFFVDCMYNVRSKFLKEVDPAKLWLRGLAYSEYKHVYEYALGVTSIEPENTSAENDSFAQALQQLHVSVVQNTAGATSLPCREQESSDIMQYIQTAIKHGGGMPALYIAGMPGTGKTATVHDVVRRLQISMREGALAQFVFVEINCLRISHARAAYTQLWEAFSGQLLGHAEALKRLDQAFTKGRASERHVVCLVDEVDYMITRQQDVVYNFFHWPRLPNTGLTVIAISNTVNITDQLHARVGSRMPECTRITFMPYSHEQIHTILKVRLGKIDLFAKRALEIAARKAAAVAGDLRTALRVCHRAVEIRREVYVALKEARGEDGVTEADRLVTIEDVTRATNEHKRGPMVVALSQGCALTKGIVIAAVKHERATGSNSIALHTLWLRLCDVAESVGEELLPTPPYEIFEERLQAICEQGLLTIIPPTAASSGGPLEGPFYSLAVSSGDVVHLLQDDPIGSKEFPSMNR